MRKYAIFDKMPFGKRAGDIIGTVIEEDADYINWLVNNTEFRLDEQGLEYLQENME